MSPFMDMNDTDAHEKNVMLQDIKLLKSMWPHIKPHWRPLLASLLLLPLLSLSQVFQPVLVKRAIDGPITQGDLSGLWGMALALLGLILAQYGLRYLQLYLAQIAGQRIVLSIRTALYNHLQSLPTGFYHKTPLGKIITRVSSDVENINEVFASGGIAIFADIAVIVGIIIAMFWMNEQLASIVLLMVPLVVITMEFFRRKSRAIYNEIRVQLAQINSNLQEALTGIDVIQLLQREKRNIRAFEAETRTYMGTNYKSVLFDSSFTASVELLSFTTILLILGYFVWNQQTAVAGTVLTFGLLVAFLQYVQMLFEPIEELSDKFTIIQSGLASMDKIMELMQVQPEIQSPPQPVVMPRAKGEIRFENVCFGYNPTEPVLKQVNLTIRPGQKVALIGPSGAGKSTIAKLINRQYDPQMGRILLDGVDIRQLDVQELRRQIVVIPQEEFLFSRTVAENITLGYQTQIDEERLKAVAEQVHADTVINPLPDGYQTILPERGRNLSNGERQLLVFARALWHDPSILILDEATSSIDPRTEQLIQDALSKTLMDRTAIIIAHRLSTIEQVDMVYVIDNGAVVEAGSPQELYHRDGLYRHYLQQGDIHDYKSLSVETRN